MKVWLPFVEAGTGADIFTLNLAEALERQGVEVEVSRFAHAWQYFPWRMRLAPTPKGTNIILANSWNAFAFRRRGVRLVVVEHLFVLDPALGPYRNFAQSVFHNLFIRLFLFLSYRAADAVVAISAYVNKQILGVFPWLKPIIIYNGIDTDFFTPGPEHDERADNAKKRLLFMGLPSRRKGADLFPRIMSELGDGYELHYTSARGQDDALKGHPRIESIGWVDKHRARDAYRNADLLLFPSRLEGFGLVVAESLACGTPVIVSNSSSLPEIVQDGLTGKICDVDDVRCLTDAVRDFTSNREKMKQAGIEAREQATRHLSLDRMVREYLALFRRLVPDSRPCKQ